MNISEFKYKLPKNQIAKYPPKERGTSNLLVLDRKNGRMKDMKYFHIPKYLKKGDIVVLNETKVLRCRTYFNTLKGKKVEVLFLENIGNDIWYVLIGRAKNVVIGDILQNQNDKDIQINIKERKGNGYVVDFKTGTSIKLFEKHGHTPLPPYIEREDEESDKDRYNTVFSQTLGAVAAPTASLNLTEKMLTEIESRGAKIVKVDLRVGWGTFAPVREGNVENHKIHEEYICIKKDAVDIINEAIKNGKRIWAFGTTVARLLESVAYMYSESDIYLVKEYEGKTNLYIYPGYEWKVVDVLVTNFHMPNSSLILLVNSFAGKERIKKAYQYAMDNGYKFLSYGDSMLIGDNIIE